MGKKPQRMKVHNSGIAQDYADRYLPERKKMSQEKFTEIANNNHNPNPDEIIFYRLIPKDFKTLLSELRHRYYYAKTTPENYEHFYIFVATAFKNAEIVRQLATKYQSGIVRTTRTEIEAILTKNKARLPLRIYKAFDGTEIYDPSLIAQYQRHNDPTSRCAADEKMRESKAGHGGNHKNEPPMTVVKIEPGLDFNMEGVITSLEKTKERLYEQLEIVEGLLTNLKAFNENREKLIALNKEVAERREAVKKILSETH